MTNALMDLSNGLADAVERAARGVVSVNEGGRSGVSGTIWREGLIVTAEHTIRDLQELTVGLPPGETLRAALVGRDPGTDIALLRLKDPVPADVEFADASQLRVGQFVLAVGRRPDHGVVASHGIISALRGAWRTWSGGRIDQWFRLDLLPYTGFSGGPLVDARGRVIGVNTSGPHRSVVTVPASTVNRVVEQLLSKGRVARGFIGVALQPVRLPAAIQASTGVASGRGLLVVMVEPGGPADQSGMMIGDIVVALEDQPLTNTSDLQLALDPEKVGQTVALRLVRGGKALALSLVIGEKPE